VERISPEAPVPVLDLRDETYALGGAANVAHNLAKLGAQVDIIGATGTDLERQTLTSLLSDARIGVGGVLEDHHRPTTSKTRVIGHNQQIVRVDRERRTPIDADLVSRARDFLEAQLPELSCIVISDYAKGVITEPLLDAVRALLRGRDVPVVVDPKNANFGVYRDFTVMTPNQGEAALGAGFKIKDELTLVEAGYKLRAALNLEAVLITRGPQGMSLFQKAKEVVHIPARVRGVDDVTGAGDTVTSVMALSLAAGISLPDAAHLAHYAAGIGVGKFGTATVQLDELRALAEHMEG
jgi:D-beta-D-heptose 7-phosphate kinase/D-beta-D-heptose 1-phosphate adenosyltransferase